MLCGSCIQTKKQFKVQIIGILEEIDPSSSITFRHGVHALIWENALCIALTCVKLKTAENVGTNTKMYWLIVRKPLAVKNDGRLSSGRASAWIAAWLETQGFFLLFAILRPTLFTGKRGLYFKSETWTKSLVVEF